jgi:hypothetical protein
MFSEFPQQISALTQRPLPLLYKTRFPAFDPVLTNRKPQK